MELKLPLNLERLVFIPAYNEEKFIRTVLANLKETNRLKKVFDYLLVINDGSKDKTSIIAKEFADQVYEIPKNKGKAYIFFELVKAVHKSRIKTIISLDADLKSINYKQLETLIQPLSDPIINMSVGKRLNAGSNLSGERAFKVNSFKKLLEDRHLQEILLGNWWKRGGFGLEYFLNFYYNQSFNLDDPEIKEKHAVYSEAIFDAHPPGIIREGKQRYFPTLLKELDRMKRKIIQKKNYFQ